MNGTHAGSDRVMIRLPDGMRDDLKIRAVRNRRTLGSEVLLLIERGLAAEKTAPEPTA